MEIKQSTTIYQAVKLSGFIGLMIFGIFMAFNIYYQPCQANLPLPTIAEFGQGYVVMGGNKSKVFVGTNYTFKDAVIKLFRADPQSATILYHDIPYKFWGISLVGTRIHCRKDITANDKFFTPKLKNVDQLKSEFDNDWNLYQVTEYVPYLDDILPYYDNSDDSTGLYLRALHNQENYVINIRFWFYNSETLAEQDFRFYKRHFQPTRVYDEFVSLFENHLHSCQLGHETYSCLYVGQNNGIIVEIEMRVDSNEIPQPKIPLKEWQYIVTLIEMHQWLIEPSVTK